jgi:flagellar basal-body rod protein FlgC
MAGQLSIFDISGRAMAAQLVRLNTTASNLANAGAVSGSEANAFRAIKPVFRTVTGSDGQATVAIDRIMTTNATPTKRHDPNHPLADANGDVFEAAVDQAAELVEMIAHTRHIEARPMTDPVSSTLYTPTTTLPRSTLSATDFLRLMTEQLKQQDPFAPTDNAQMVTQMAQMSASSATAEMNASLKVIAAQIADQTALLQSIAAQRQAEMPAETPAP